jgi:hypothetical protein
MTEIRGVTNQKTVVRTDEDDRRNIRLGYGGETINIPWLQALVLEGRMFGVAYGAANNTVATVGTFGAGAIDLDEFDLLQTVPATVAVLPAYYKVAFDAIGTIAAVHVALAWGQTGVITAGITCTPYNLNTGSTLTSLCTVAGLGDDGGTACTVSGVIYQEATTALTGVAATPAMLGYEWSAGKAGFVPVIKGLVSPTRQVFGWAAAQGGTGFITYQWAELPLEAIE